MSEINPHISVDCVIFGFDQNKLKILLLERTLKCPEEKKVLFSDHTLPGNHIRNDEEIQTAAERVLKELTGISGLYMEQFAVFSQVNRLKNRRDKTWLEAIGKNPDERVITVGFYSLIPVDRLSITVNNHDQNPFWYGKNPSWHSLDMIGEMAFDHEEIIHQALLALRERAIIKPLVYNLLPKKFTLTQLQKVYEVILDIKLDKRNFRRKILNSGMVIPTNIKQKGVCHKPAELFRYNLAKFKKATSNPLYY